MELTVGYWNLKQANDARLVDGLRREEAQGLAATLKAFGTSAKAGARAGAVRQKGNPGGWFWYAICPYAWVARLFEAAKRIEEDGLIGDENGMVFTPAPAVRVVQDCLKGIKRSGVTLEQLDTAWRLGGAKAMDALLHTNGYKSDLHFIFSFFDGPEQG